MSRETKLVWMMVALVIVLAALPLVVNLGRDKTKPGDVATEGRNYGQAVNVPEHANQVLDQLLGTWDWQATIFAAEPDAVETHTTGRNTFARVLVFIHLAIRKVYCSPATFNPTADWVMQQTRNANRWPDDMGVKPRFVIHDRD